MYWLQYYPLDVSFFKSSLDARLLDALWSKYWVATLSSSPLLATRELVTGQLQDVTRKLEAAESQAGASARVGKFLMPTDKKKGKPVVGHLIPLLVF